MEVENISVIISGGASGMGAAVARFLAARGMKIAILDIDNSSGEKIAKKINGLYISCDITHKEKTQQALQECEAQQGTARVCINCAGIAPSKRMIGKEGLLPLEEFRRVIDIDLIGTFNLMQLAAANMMKLDTVNDSGERGVIINTASIAAYEGQIGQTAYSAAKAGVVGLTLPAARELASSGIRVMTIAPGLVDTSLFEKISTEARLALMNSVPFPKRLARPEEFASLVLHIIQNPMLNGETIRLDGALRMAPK